MLTVEAISIHPNAYRYKSIDIAPGLQWYQVSGSACFFLFCSSVAGSRAAHAGDGRRDVRPVLAAALLSRAARPLHASCVGGDAAPRLSRAARTVARRRQQLRQSVHLLLLQRQLPAGNPRRVAQPVAVRKDHDVRNEGRSTSGRLSRVALSTASYRDNACVRWLSTLLH